MTGFIRENYKLNTHPQIADGCLIYSELTILKSVIRHLSSVIYFRVFPPYSHPTISSPLYKNHTVLDHRQWRSGRNRWLRYHDGVLSLLRAYNGPVNRPGIV